MDHVQPGGWFFPLGSGGLFTLPRCISPSPSPSPSSSPSPSLSPFRAPRTSALPSGRDPPCPLPPKYPSEFLSSLYSAYILDQPPHVRLRYSPFGIPYGFGSNNAVKGNGATIDASMGLLANWSWSMRMRTSLDGNPCISSRSTGIPAPIDTRRSTTTEPSSGRSCCPSTAARTIPAAPRTKAAHGTAHRMPRYQPPSLRFLF